jgi:hypothetical protein
MYEGIGLIIAARPGSTGSYMHVVTEIKNKYRNGMEVSNVFEKVERPDFLYIKEERHNDLVYKINLDEKGLFRGEDVKYLLAI